MPEHGCTNEQARAYVADLVGDGDARAPGVNGRPGKPYFMLFASQGDLSARLEYEQVKQLPEHMRLRDLMERLGVDGRETR